MASSLVADIIDRMQRLTNRVDPEYRTRALSALDEAQQWVRQRMAMDGPLREEEFVCDGTSFLILPERVMRVVRIADVTNYRALKAGGQWEDRAEGAYLQRSAGQPYEWRVGGTVPVTKTIGGEKITVESTASESITVVVRGLAQDTTASGTALEYYETQETITLGGSAADSSNIYQSITSLQKDKDTTNDVKITRKTTGDLIGRIPSWLSRSQYTRIELAYVPTGGTILRVWFQERPARITSEDDALDPSINEEALMWRAAGNLHWNENEGQAAQTAWTKAEEVLTNIKNVEENFGERNNQITPYSIYDNEDLGLEP